MDRMKIAAIFADQEQLGGKEITVCGWARTIRDMKTFGFIELNDGSCFRNLQVVMSADGCRDRRGGPVHPHYPLQKSATVWNSCGPSSICPHGAGRWRCRMWIRVFEQLEHVDKGLKARLEFPPRRPGQLYRAVEQRQSSTYRVDWGTDLQTEHDAILTEQVFQSRCLKILTIPN